MSKTPRVTLAQLADTQHNLLRACNAYHKAHRQDPGGPWIREYARLARDSNGRPLDPFGPLAGAMLGHELAAALLSVWYGECAGLAARNVDARAMELMVALSKHGADEPELELALAAMYGVQTYVILEGCEPEDGERFVLDCLTRGTVEVLLSLD